MGMPVYVGCSIDLSELVAEEQMEGMAKIIETVMGKWEEHQKEKAGWHDKDWKSCEIIQCLMAVWRS